MRIYDFVNWELQKFRDECNFTPDELAYFNLRSKQYTNQQIAIKMNVSESQVSKLARRVKNKIMRVI